MKTFKPARIGRLAVNTDGKEAIRHLAVAIDRIEDALADIPNAVKKLGDGQQGGSQGQNITITTVTAAADNDFLYMPGRATQQYLANATTGNSTLEIRRSTTGDLVDDPPILELTNSGGTHALVEVDWGGRLVMQPNSNVDNLLHIIPGVTGVASTGCNRAIYIEPNPDILNLTPDSTCIEIQNHTTRTMALSWNGRITLGTGVGVTVGPVVSATGFSLSGSSREAILTLSALNTTTARTFTFPDKDGTFAMLSDVGGGSMDYAAAAAIGGFGL